MLVRKQMEEWKDLGCIGQPSYAVSNFGRARNSITGRILAQATNKGGYKTTNVGSSTSQSKLVHRLVAQAFLPNPEDAPVVHHINHDRSDARLSNLRWATHSENSRDKNTSNIPARYLAKAFDFSGETWKPANLPFSTKYETVASDHGRVRWSTCATMITTIGSGRGYLAVRLRDVHGKRRVVLVHRLVAATFCQQGGPVVNHLNGDSMDNRASNLEWVTMSQNSQHSWDRDGSIRQKRAVQQFTLGGQLVAEHDSVKTAARVAATTFDFMYKACSGRRETCKGFVWKYRDKKLTPVQNI